MAAAEAPRTAPTAPWFRRLTFHGLLASVCPLIPIPWLDDWALGWVRRRQAGETLAAWGVQPLDWHLDTLSWEGERPSRGGCVRLVGLLAHPVVYLAKKLFRKLVVFLTLKDGVDAFSRSFHEGYLLHRAFERGILDARTLAGGYRLLAVRQAIVDTCEAMDPRPVNQLVRRSLRGSRRLLVTTSRWLGQRLRPERRRSAAAAVEVARVGLEDRDERLADLADRLADDLWLDRSYLRALDALFDRSLAGRRLEERAASEGPSLPGPDPEPA